VKLRAESASLLDFMVYQAIRDFKRGMVGLICQRCAGYFVAGPGKRRADSEYCTDVCQKRANDERKAQKKAARKLAENHNQPTT
jgi:hypothetical protein